MQLSELNGLNVRIQHALYRVGINSVEELTSKTEDDLMSIHDFGVKSLGDVESALAEKGLSLKKCNNAHKDSEEKVPQLPKEDAVASCYEVVYDLYVHVTGSIFLEKKPLTLEEKEKMIFSNDGIRKVEDITTNPINSYEGHLSIYERGNK